MDIEVEFLEANVCVVCLAENPNLLEVQFDERQVPTIGPIMVKHLWFQPEELHYKHICEECWNQVNQFHIFYSSMQKAHSNLKSSIETVDIVESFKAEPSSYTAEFHDTYLVEVEQPQSTDLKQEENENLPLQKETNAHNSQEKHDEHKEMEEEEVEHEDDYEEEGHSDYEPNESKTGSESSDSDTEKAKEIPKKVRKKQTTGKVSKTAERNYNKSIEQIEEEDKKISDHCKLQCAECETTFPRFSDYKQHARKAHQIAHPVVICCDRRFNKRIKLLEHATKRMNPDAFRCTLCEKSYCNSLNLRLHMLRHNPPDAMKHKCDQCDRSFAKRYQLTAHQQTHVPEDERKFICSTCNKSFATSSQLNVHTKSRHLPPELYICEVCAKHFKTRSQFEKHRLEHSESYQEIRQQCKICSKWMKNASSLRKHVLRHEGEGEIHECELCGKRAPNILALQSHISFVHKKDKLYQCTLCPKAFKRQFTLVEHMTTHTGEVLYKCSFCSKSFNSSANMHAHKKKMHPQEWEAASHKVFCSEDQMRVNVALPSNDTSTTSVYLEGMKGYPDPKCKPTIKDTLAEFELSLLNIYECGVTRVVNKITGKKVFYHRVIIEGDQEFGKEVINVKCITNGPLYNITHGIVKRDVLPAGFQEPEDLEITSNITGSAPEPSLDIAVRQGNVRVSGDLNVSPGTNLQMEIFLDDKSAPIYGLGVNYMQVTDTLSQEETIIYNGCSVDPYLFENFNTVDGDLLTAKFRAFKFPESTYVQFRGTVNVCVDRCKGVICSNGQTAYGRRRREISQSATDPNKVYEVTMTTFIKVNYDEDADKSTASEIDQKFRQLKLANQKLARNSRAGNVFESIHVSKMAETSPSENAKVEETILFTREVISQPQETGRSSSCRHLPASLIVTIFITMGLMLRKSFR